MKIAICAANKVGAELIPFVLDYPHSIEMVAVHPDDFPHYRQSIMDDVSRRGVDLFYGIHKGFLDECKVRDVDIVCMLWFPEIIKKYAIGQVNIGWTNLHPALLPWGRGKHDYYWCLQEGHPFGVSIHFIDEGIDTGPVLFQREIPYSMLDTGETLYKKSERALVELFIESYPKIVSGEFEAKPQSGTYTFRWGRELEPHSTIDMDKSYVARDLVNRIRGRSFTDGDSCHFWDNGKEYRIKTTIEEVE